MFVDNIFFSVVGFCRTLIFLCPIFESSFCLSYIVCPFCRNPGVYGTFRIIFLLLFCVFLLTVDVSSVWCIVHFFM